MKVLVISGNTLPMSPTGAALVAGMARDAGHEVRVFDCLTASDPVPALAGILARFEPDLVPLSIPMVTCDTPSRTMDMPRGYADIHSLLRSLVEQVHRRTHAVVVAGGRGFDTFPRDWLIYLNLEYGLVGECDRSFPMFMENLHRPTALAQIPGIVIRSGERVDYQPLDTVAHVGPQPVPAYDLFDVDRYNHMGIPWGMTTKRGCIRDCRHCSGRGGKGYRLKAPTRVISEIRRIREMTGSRDVIFCDTCLNRPPFHFKLLLEELAGLEAPIRWRGASFKPTGISRSLCQMLEASGCIYAGLSVETASERMLANLNRGFQVADIRRSLDCLSETNIDFGVSLLVGAPGETMVSIRETLEVLDAYPGIKAVWVNVGVFGLGIRPRTPSEGFFQDGHYISPELDPDDMVDLIDELALRPNYLIQVSKPYAGFKRN